MKERTKNIITLLLIGGLIFGLALWCVLKPADDTSDAERRPLAQMPEISIRASSLRTLRSTPQISSPSGRDSEA